MFAKARRATAPGYSGSSRAEKLRSPLLDLGSHLVAFYPKVRVGDKSYRLWYWRKDEAVITRLHQRLIYLPLLPNACILSNQCMIAKSFGQPFTEIHKL